jgi:hypothetical protein
MITLKAAAFLSDYGHRHGLVCDATPFKIATVLAEDGSVKDETILVAALLKHLSKDVGIEEIQFAFGNAVADLVAEFDSVPTKTAQQRLEWAPTLSHKASLIVLAETIFEVHKIVAQPPNHWSRSRVQGYCVWLKALTSRLRCIGSEESVYLEATLEKSLASSVNDGGKRFPCIPPDCNEAEMLQDFLYCELQRAIQVE